MVPRSNSVVADYVVVELAADETHPLRLEVLRGDTPSRVVVFSEDGLPGTVHLGVRDGDAVVAISTWVPRPHRDEPAVQLRGMATAPHVQGRGVGAILLDAGCRRAATVAPLVWARARDTALGFYISHGFTVDGDGFIDEHTQKPHHLITRRLP
jgi:GNAT superfamily N-acetyltransferase